MAIVMHFEIQSIKQEVSKVDPNAFFYVQSIKEVKGGTIKQSGIDA